MPEQYEEVAHFIRLIRGISPQYLRYACTRGGCHRFYLVLKDRFPKARLYLTRLNNGGHCVARIGRWYWDIWGEHDPKEDGAVDLADKDSERRMSSCHFDEGFILQNTGRILEADRRKRKKT